MENQDQKMISRIKKRWTNYKKAYANLIERANTDMEFYRGEQWTDTQKQYLEEKGKPAIVKNRIAPRVELLTGYQRQNRYYFKVIMSDLVPDESKQEYELLTEKYTAKLKEIEDLNDGEYELTDCFKEGAICGISNLEAFIHDDKESIYPDPRVEFRHRPHDQVYKDPEDTSYDGSKARDWFKVVFMSRDELIEMFPDKKDIIKDLTPESDDIKQKETHETDDYADKTIDSNIQLEKDFLLKEYWYYEVVKKKYLISNTLPEAQDVTATAEQTQEMFQKRKEFDPTLKFNIREVHQKVWYVCFYVSGVILDKRPSNIDESPFVSYLPNVVKTFDDLEMRYRGLVTQMISPQKELNVRESKALESLNKTVSGGWAYEENALTDAQKDKLEEYGSIAGFHMETKDNALTSGKVQQIVPNPLDQGQLIMADRADNEFDSLTNIHADLLGASGDTKSGRAIDLRIQQGMMGIHTYFDNFRRTKHLLCRKLLKMLCYIDGVDFYKLKIVIDDTIMSPTARYATLTESRELAEMGAFDPNNPLADIMVDNSNLANKEEIKQRLIKLQDLQGREQRLQQIEQQFQQQAAQQAAMEDVNREMGRVG